MSDEIKKTLEMSSDSRLIYMAKGQTNVLSLELAKRLEALEAKYKQSLIALTNAEVKLKEKGEELENYEKAYTLSQTEEEKENWLRNKVNLQQQQIEALAETVIEITEVVSTGSDHSKVHQIVESY